MLTGQRPTLSEAERLLWTNRRLEAQQAKHDLLTGKKLEQFIDQNGEQVRYTKATVDGPNGLNAYISEIDALLNPQYAAAMTRRAIGFLF